jgi:hypothetical protein
MARKADRQIGGGAARRNGAESTRTNIHRNASRIQAPDLDLRPGGARGQIGVPV